jgi:hypothetical protein
MKFTFLEQQKNGRDLFIDTTDYNNRLIVGTGRQNISSLGVQTEKVSGAIVRTRPVVVQQDPNSPTSASAKFTKTLRVEFSSVVGHTNDIAGELRGIADFIEANPRVLSGIPLQTATDLDFAPVEGA